METSRGLRVMFRGKPFVLWVIAGGLAFIGLGLIALFASFGGSVTDPTTLIILAIVAVFLLSAYGTLKAKRWGLIAGIVVTVLTLALFSFIIPTAYANPASPGAWLTVASLPISFLVLGFSIVSLRKWKAGIEHTKYLASLESTGGLVSVAILGFAVGSLVASVAAAPLILHLLSGSGESADIRIVQGAPAAADPYVPRNFTVARNTTVTWFNGDSNDHTVTSDPGVSPAFGSPLLHSGDRFSFRFTVPGTFPYHCEPHPNMKGTIIVT